MLKIPFIVSLLVLTWPVAARAQCTKDTDCKGERICEAGSCVNPGASHAAPAVNDKRSARAGQGGNRVLLTVDANMKRGWEWVAGKLIVTRRALIFSPHSGNFQRGERRIKINRIKKLETFGLIPNGLRVRVKGGKKYEFRVNKRGTVMKTIRQNM